MISRYVKRVIPKDFGSLKANLFNNLSNCNLRLLLYVENLKNSKDNIFPHCQNCQKPEREKLRKKLIFCISSIELLDNLYSSKLEILKIFNLLYLELRSNISVFFIFELLYYYHYCTELSHFFRWGYQHQKYTNLLKMKIKCDTIQSRDTCIKNLKYTHTKIRREYMKLKMGITTSRSKKKSFFPNIFDLGFLYVQWKSQASIWLVIKICNTFLSRNMLDQKV